MGRGVANRPGLRRLGLHEHPPAPLAAPAPPGELGVKRESTFLGAKVGEAKRRIGVQHDAQHHVGEVVSLGDHLGADQHSRRRLLEAPQDLDVGAPACRGIGVEPEDRQGGNRLVEQGGQALRPGAVAGEGDRAAR